MAADLNNLASLFSDRGDYRRAEPFYELALATWEKAFGPNHPKVALALNNLGTLLAYKGDYARAEPLLLRALNINGNVSNDLDSARTLNNLSELYNARNEVARAEPLQRKALALLESKLGPDHPEVANGLNGLASERLARGDSAEAEALERRVSSVPSPRSRRASIALTTRGLQGGLAEILTGEGRLRRRRAPVRAGDRGLCSCGCFRDAHPDLAKTLVGQSLLYWAKGDAARAVAAMARGMDVRERNVSRDAVDGLEDQRRAFSRGVAVRGPTGRSDWACAGFPADPTARRLAMLAVLRRKGRLLDVMSDTTRVFRGHLSPEDRTVFDQLRATRSDIARRSLAGPRPGTSLEDHRRTLQALERSADAAEAQIASRSAAFRVAAQPVTVDAVAAALPGDSALVEIVKYAPFDPRAAFGTPPARPRYAAYVLRHDAEVAYSDLGEAAIIDDLVARLRHALDGRTSDERSIARALDERRMQPRPSAPLGSQALPDRAGRVARSDPLRGAGGRERSLPARDLVVQLPVDRPRPAPPVEGGAANLGARRRESELRREGRRAPARVRRRAGRSGNDPLVRPSQRVQAAAGDRAGMDAAVQPPCRARDCSRGRRPPPARWPG